MPASRSPAPDESGSEGEEVQVRPNKSINHAWLRAIRKLDMVLPIATTRDPDSEDAENVELQMNRILNNIKAEMETAG